MGGDLEVYDETILSLTRLLLARVFDHSNREETRLEQAFAVATDNPIPEATSHTDLFLAQVSQELHSSGLGGICWGGFCSLCLFLPGPQMKAFAVLMEKADILESWSPCI